MITWLLHIPQALLPSTYLGVPIFLGTSGHSHFNLILDSIRARLASQKSKCLSFACRLILVKHLLSSIPLHISLVILIPSKTYLQIEHLMRNFLWSASPKKMSSNLVNWETLCLPKSEGGLGLCRVKAVSIDSLWARWFHARYFRRSSIQHSGNPKGGSCIWKRIRSLAFYLQRGNSWKLGNGISIKVWFDNWIDHDPIASRFSHLEFSEWDLVANIIQNNSACIPTHLPVELQAFLLQSSSHIPIGGILVPDTLSWQGNHSGKLSLKEAWHTLRTSQAVVNWSAQSGTRS